MAQRAISKVGGERFPHVLRLVAGPIGLGTYAITQTLGTNPNGLGALVWVAAFAVGLSILFAVRHRASTTQVMAIEVLASALVTDGQNSTDGALRDLSLYLHAGSQFLSGMPVYTSVPIDHYPALGQGYLPFLYAPPTIPIFALLSVPPFWLVGSLWVIFSVAAIAWSLHTFGLSWKWALLALLWPPIEQGIFTGNVVIPSLALLAIAPRVGGLLGLGTLLKPQNGIVWLWLVRERAWRTLAISVAVLVSFVVVTLPLTGIGLWRDWVQGLSAYQQSQGILPGLYGIGLGRWLPAWIFYPLAAAVVVVALQYRGRKGMARLGLASVIASPSLWSHGFIYAIPEFLRLRGQWFWIAAGLCAGGRWPGPQAAISLAAIGWFAGPLVSRFTERLLPRTSPPSSLATHPLGNRAVEVLPPPEGRS